MACKRQVRQSREHRPGPPGLKSNKEGKKMSPHRWPRHWAKRRSHKGLACCSESQCQYRQQGTVRAACEFPSSWRCGSKSWPTPERYRKSWG
eukprot:4679671-Pyramimonas_sp.AAC.1